MRRTCLVAALMVCFVGVTRPAAAQWWSWMEEYSGPGPFASQHDSFTFTPLCFGRADPTRTAETWVERRIGLSSADARWCITVDTHGFTAEPEPVQGYPRIDARLTDFGASAPIHPALDVGMAIGWISFTSDPDGANSKTNRLALTPIRVAVKPALLIYDFRSTKNRALAAAVKVFYKETFVRGELTGADFGAAASQFRVDGESVRTMGLMIDLTELLRVPRWGQSPP